MFCLVVAYRPGARRRRVLRVAALAGAPKWNNKKNIALYWGRPPSDTDFVSFSRRRRCVRVSVYV